MLCVICITDKSYILNIQTIFKTWEKKIENNRIMDKKWEHIIHKKENTQRPLIIWKDNRYLHPFICHKENTEKVKPELMRLRVEDEWSEVERQKKWMV